VIVGSVAALTVSLTTDSPAPVGNQGVKRHQRDAQPTTVPSADREAQTDSRPSPLLALNPGRGRTDVLVAFERWLGRRVDLVEDAISRRDWKSIADPADEVAPWQQLRRSLVVTVPMLPRAGASLSRGASGHYDHQFALLAERLVAAGYGDAIIRLGHEANGAWFPWAAARDPAAYVAYWRRIVGTMRSVSGAAFRFDWTVARGPQAVPADRIYPGDDVVDIIGMDVYDRDPQFPPGPERWAKFRTQPFGLDWLASFAAAHGKPLSISEWGLALSDNGNGGGDNPLFVEEMWRWLHDHDVAYHAYFEVDAPGNRHRLLSGRFPRAAQRFRELFGAPRPPGGGSQPARK
jgi:hypothetical protein